MEKVTETRETWGNKREFLLSCIGYAVGLGNIWRFPYLCFESGGGAFLLPYFITLLLCGIPLLYLELAVGQLTGAGPVHAIASLCPLMKGVGVATVVISFVLATYYNVIMTWAIYYLYKSFTWELPWYSCNADWASVNCTENALANMTSSFANGTTSNRRSPLQDFFDRAVLNKSAGLDDMGGIQVHLFVCFICAWVLCYLGIFNGVKSVGKVVHVTVLLPYVLLITLLIASCQLPGALNGFLFFVKPRWGDIARMEIWVMAAAQNFNSIGIAFGAMIAFSSYNRRKEHLLRDTLTITTVNCFTSILAGVAIFCAMGHMAFLLDTEVDKVVKDGPELVFILYPQIFPNLPAPYMWSILFFTMIIMLGIDSQFGNIEVVVTTLADSFDGQLLQRFFFGRKKLLSLFVCCIGFLCGLPNICSGGIYIFTLLDKHNAVVSLMFIAFFEIVALCWLYGAKQIARDIKSMTGKEPGRFFVINWLVVAPTLVGAILIFTVVGFKPAKYGTYKYPLWAHAIGWLLTASSLLCIPAFAIAALANVGRTSSLWQRFRMSITPTMVRVAGVDEINDYKLQPVATK